MSFHVGGGELAHLVVVSGHSISVKMITRTLF